MPKQILQQETTALSRATEAARAATVFVDVAQESTRAEVSRGGIPLGEIRVKPEIVDSFLDDLAVVRTKVVTQTIVAGTAVARGTAIDIVIANASNLPVRVVPGVHAAFEGLTMAQLNDQFATNTVIRDIVRQRPSPDDLTTAERETLTTAFQAAHVAIDNANPVDAAFIGVKAAFTFQG